MGGAEGAERQVDGTAGSHHLGGELKNDILAAATPAGWMCYCSRSERRWEPDMTGDGTGWQGCAGSHVRSWRGWSCPVTSLRPACRDPANTSVAVRKGDA